MEKPWGRGVNIATLDVHVEEDFQGFECFKYSPREKLGRWVGATWTHFVLKTERHRVYYLNICLEVIGGEGYLSQKFIMKGLI